MNHLTKTSFFISLQSLIVLIFFLSYLIPKCRLDPKKQYNHLWLCSLLKKISIHPIFDGFTYIIYNMIHRGVLF
jgi:hypothetical protein